MGDEPAAPGAGAVADGDAAAVASSRCATRSKTGSPTTATRSWPRCRGCTRRSPPASSRMLRRRRWPCRRSCAWARGSAATATAIRSSRRETLEYAIRAQAAVAFDHYLDAVHRLGAELSLSARLVEPTPALLALVAAAHDANPHRQDEPYRQRADRHLCASGRDVDGADRAARPRARRTRRCPPTTRRRRSLADLAVIRASLATHRAALLADAAPDAARSTPCAAFGFHLASLDLRQNADVHEAVVAELLARAGVAPDYVAAVRRPTRVALLAARARHAASARVAAPRLRRAHALGARDPRRGGRHPSPLRRGGACRTTSSRKCAVGVGPARGRACC